MEQMYLIEIFVDKVTVFASDDDNCADKKLIIKVKFGPKVEFIIKEGQLAHNDKKQDDIIQSADNGRRKWSRTIRVGKSYLFPSYADTILMILSKFPLEIELWNDDDKEVDIFIGVGTMYWDTDFFHMLKDTADPCKMHEPLCVKQTTPLYGDCYCKQVGEIDFILRLSALGDSIITEFQQLMPDPDSFVFRTNRAPSMFQCKRIEGDDPNFCMVGSLYETTTLEDPTVAQAANKKIEICIDADTCATKQKDDNLKCSPPGQEESENKKHVYPIDKIRMGDITGPCGNTNCVLAQKVKAYIRSLDSYKKEAQGKISEHRKPNPKKVCGSCICKDDRWHRETCPEKCDGNNKAVCSGCGGITKKGETCEDVKNKMEAPVTTQVTYVLNVTKNGNLKESLYGKEYALQSLNHLLGRKCLDDVSNCSLSVSCQTLQDKRSRKNISQTSSDHVLNNLNIYNFQISESRRKLAIFNCFDIPASNDCTCAPPKEPPPCKSFDCACISKAADTAIRKVHKSYCPAYKHKATCPVTLINEVTETKEDDENENEPLPYGLPPINLGPCPVLGRPCTVPDGFARMYKTAALPAQPPSYSNAGKVCCSKEYERIKKILNECMKYEKEHDYRCVKRFYVDTERRCCDKEQHLLSLLGKTCCGTHKVAILERYEDGKKLPL